MAANRIPQARQIDRVPSMTVQLDLAQETRFQGLVEEVTMVDVHQHPFVLPEDMGLFIDYLRTNSYSWGYDAVKHGGWSAVTTANVFRGLVNAQDMSFVEYDDVLGEVSMMLADISLQKDVVKVGNANDIEAAKQQGNVGFMPTLEHLAIGYQLDRVDYPDTSYTDYNYDALGNRTTVDENGTVITYTIGVGIDLNQYDSVNSTSYTYDDNGNLSDDGTYIYGYDAENQLELVTTPHTIRPGSPA